MRDITTDPTVKTRGSELVSVAQTMEYTDACSCILGHAVPWVQLNHITMSSQHANTTRTISLVWGLFYTNMDLNFSMEQLNQSKTQPLAPNSSTYVTLWCMLCSEYSWKKKSRIRPKPAPISWTWSSVRQIWFQIFLWFFKILDLHRGAPASTAFLTQLSHK